VGHLLEQVAPYDLFEQLTAVFTKGLPQDIDLQSVSVRNIFSAVLCNRVVFKSDVPPEDDQNALRQCYRNGWLHSDMCRKDIDQLEAVGYVFASPLHRWFVEWKLVNTSAWPVVPSLQV
jgi:hypothetical protein